MREARIAELETIVGERTEKERKALLGVSDETFELVVKYAKLAQFKATAVKMAVAMEDKPSRKKEKI